MDTLKSKRNVTTRSKRLGLVPFIFLMVLGFLGTSWLHKSSKIKTETSVDQPTEIKNEEENHWNYLSSSVHSHFNKLWNDDDSKYDDSKYDDSKDDKSKCNFENYILAQPVEQDDPCLIATIKKNIIVAPPPPSEVNRDESTIPDEIPSNIEKLKWVEKLLIERPDYDKDQAGFFIEMGANDGMFISPTVRLEMRYNWRGLLVEANPIPFKSLLEKKRNCWAINAAACTTPHPGQITFYSNPSNTGISGLNERKEHGVTVNETVQCLPLYSMLAALDIKTVDYFSLDVEGFEIAVLETVPFDKIKFKVITVEYNMVPGKEQTVKEFFEPKGYKYVKHINDGLTDDVLYVHESLYELAASIKI